MIDYETWGKTPDCVVRALALVMFGAEQTKTPLLIDARPSIDNQLEHGRSVDPETVAFWQRQNPVLSEILDRHYGAESIKVSSIHSIVGEINQFFELYQPDYIWSRRHLDMQLTHHLFDQAGCPIPWTYDQVMDCSAFDLICERPMPPTPHDPMSDCIAQIDHVQTAMAIAETALPRNLRKQAC
ncbi:MAG: 3'-5' exoribonuclease [Candidatus Thiodiazotropha sp. (ex Epidulcina cf. delphinae)]|nr:3'-5' exoribonuclease [Candidatus Thiodiazotropha sp. (ex Epidulcina cf. delphinae)]